MEANLFRKTAVDGFGFVEDLRDRPHKHRFGLTTEYEKGGLGWSVGADLRAATNSSQEVAAQERGSHIELASSQRR